MNEEMMEELARYAYSLSRCQPGERYDQHCEEWDNMTTSEQNASQWRFIAHHIALRYDELRETKKPETDHDTIPNPLENSYQWP